jgi:hypothetical protein
MDGLVIFTLFETNLLKGFANIQIHRAIGKLIKQIHNTFSLFSKILSFFISVRFPHDLHQDPHGPDQELAHASHLATSPATWAHARKLAYRVQKLAGIPSLPGAHRTRNQQFSGYERL